MAKTFRSYVYGVATGTVGRRVGGGKKEEEKRMT